jgi:1-acyl-sn-glycerol-3-phosphate acyltransferase
MAERSVGWVAESRARRRPQQRARVRPRERPVAEPIGPSRPEDPFGFDEPFRDRVVPVFRFLYERYWRVEAEGLHHVPATGGAILVANHSGALPFDGAMIVTAMRLEHAQGRTLRFLYDRFVDNLGPVGTFYRRVGGVTASYPNAARLLAAGELVMMFPEGIAGVAKPFTERYRLRQFRSSFVRLSLTHRVPIIPVAVVGAEEASPVVGRAENAGKLFGIPYIPITPFFPLLGVLGAVPLPTKWFIRIGRPFEFYRPPARDDVINPAVLPPRELARRVRRAITTMVKQLRARRQSVFFG